MSIELRVIDEDFFAGMNESWDSLIRFANVDPLFSSWHWQYCWWISFKQVVDGELLVVAAYMDDKLIGVAPFLIANVKVKGIVTYRYLQLIGCSWTSNDTVRSNLLDFICLPEYGTQFGRICWDFVMANYKWDEAILDPVCKDSLVATTAPEHLTLYLRNTYENLYVDCKSSSFDLYLSDLGGNARRQVYNKRKKLESLGVNVEHEFANICGFLSGLDQMKARRWGHAAFSGNKFEFHRDFLTNMPSDRMHGYFGVLDIAGEAVSYLYCIEVGGQVYFIQSAFDEDAVSGVSLGLIHLGYAIEHAYANGKARFDLLYGKGRSNDYKRGLAKNEYLSHCYSVRRSNKAAVLNGLRNCKSVINAWLNRFSKSIDNRVISLRLHFFANHGYTSDLVGEGCGIGLNVG